MLRPGRVLLIALAVAAAVATPAQGATITEYPLPAGTPGTAGISVAGDGSVWTALSAGLYADLKPGAGLLLRLDRASGNWDSVAIRLAANRSFRPFADGTIPFTMGPLGRFFSVLDPATRTTREIADVGQAGFSDISASTIWIFRARAFSTDPASDRSILYKITQAGQQTSIQLPDNNVVPIALAAAPDESVWMVERQVRVVDFATYPRPQLTHTLSDGTRTVVPVDLGPNVTKSVDMAVGPDGVVWIATANGADATSGDILRLDPKTGVAQHFRVPVRGPIGSMVVDPDGRLWYFHVGQPYIVRFDPATATEFAYATPDPRGAPHTLTVGPDGALWYGNIANTAKQLAPTIGRIALDGESLRVDGTVAISQGIRTGVTCEAACDASAGLTVSRAGAAGARAAASKGRTVRLGRGSRRLRRAGTESLVIKLTAAARRRLRAQRTIRARLTLTRKAGGRTRITRSRVDLVVRKPKIRRSTGG